MKVLFTNPPWRDETKRRYGVRAGSRWPFTLPTPGGYKPFPFLLAYSASYLRQNGIEAEILDSIVLQHTYEQFFGEVKRINPDFVVIETSTPSLNNDLKIAEMLNKEGHKIILTGSHATIFAEDLIKLDCVDCIVKGEYEKGVLRRVLSDKGGVYDYDLIDNLDQLPFPVREPETLFFYNDNPLGCSGRQIQMWSSRGCSFQCIFCMWPPVMYRNKFRQRSVENVLQEVEECIGRFGESINIYFDDDTFNIGDKRTQNLALGIRELGVEWSAMCRADTVSLETFTLMRKCGCRGIKIGVESGCQELVDACHKKLNLEKVKAVCRHLRKVGMNFHLTFTFGLPGETQETIKRTIDFSVEARPNSVQFSLTTPFPGTPYFNMAKEKGKSISDNWDLYDGATNSVVMEELINTQLSREELCKTLKDAKESWKRRTRWRKRWGKFMRRIRWKAEDRWD